MSRNYDNWERLVAAVVKREEIRRLCHEHSRSPSISTDSSESDVDSDDSSAGMLVFFGGSVNSAFRLKYTLQGVRKLGKGAFGTTILTQLRRDVRSSDHEFLHKGTEMAAKLVKEVSAMSEEEFRQQMMAFRSCRHDNVAAPLAYYYSDKPNGKLVVYSYYKLGSVFDMLRGKKGDLGSWESRLKVAIGAARGIAHIHQQCGGKMAHGNIKSSNVFLNSQLYGCVSDFGSNMMATKICIDYGGRRFRFKNVSQECDIYRFGILLLELLTGRSCKQSGRGFGSDVQELVVWARSIKYEDFTSKLFDLKLEYNEEDRLEMVELLCVAMRCLEVHKTCRPKIGEVMLMLDSISRPYKIWSSWICSKSVPLNLSSSLGSDQKPIPKLLTIEGALRSTRKMGKGRFGSSTLTMSQRDVLLSDQQFLPKGTQLVMKKLEGEMIVTEEEFKSLLGNCRHHNVATPRAYYFSNDGYFIFNDFYSQGSLHDMLHGDSENRPDWHSRLKIAIGVAQGIAHIHGKNMIHGNITSSNIFVNSNKYGCVSDFGLATMLGKQASPGSDVYSFGLVLLQLLTGQPIMDPGLSIVGRADFVNPQDWSSEFFYHRLLSLYQSADEILSDVIDISKSKKKNLFGSLHSILDSILGMQKLTEMRKGPFCLLQLEMGEMLQVAKKCLVMLPQERPAMSEVVLMLENAYIKFRQIPPKS